MILEMEDWAGVEAEEVRWRLDARRLQADGPWLDQCLDQILTRLEVGASR
jgi:hypothetical protein